MTYVAYPYPGTTRYRVTSMTWNNGPDGQGELTSPDGRWFVQEDEHDACCNWLRAEIRRLHQDNERLRGLVPAKRDNAVCAACGTAHDDVGPCPSPSPGGEHGKG